MLLQLRVHFFLSLNDGRVLSVEVREDQEGGLAAQQKGNKAGREWRERRRGTGVPHQGDGRLRLHLIQNGPVGRRWDLDQQPSKAATYICMYEQFEAEKKSNVKA